MRILKKRLRKVFESDAEEIIQPPKKKIKFVDQPESLGPMKKYTQLMSQMNEDIIQATFNQQSTLNTEHDL